MTSVLGKNEIKLRQCHLGKKSPLRELLSHILEPLLGIFEPCLGRIKLLLGITKPVVGLKMHYLENFHRARSRNSAALEVKTPSIDLTITKAVAFLYEQSYASGSNPYENNVSVDLTKPFNPNVTGMNLL